MNTPTDVINDSNTQQKAKDNSITHLRQLVGIHLPRVKKKDLTLSVEVAPESKLELVSLSSVQGRLLFALCTTAAASSKRQANSSTKHFAAIKHT